MAKAVICNLGDLSQEQLDAQAQSVARRRYVIKARKREQKYSLTVVDDNPTGNLVDVGERDYHTSPVAGRDIAESVVKLVFGARYGIFLCEGDAPTKEEILKAEDAWRRYDMFCIAEGDKEWARTHKHENIDDNWKAASIRRGANRDWAAVSLEKVPCPFCGTLMAKDLAKCPTGCIVNVQKALAAGIITKQQAADMSEARGEMRAKPKEKEVQASA